MVIHNLLNSFPRILAASENKKVENLVNKYDKVRISKSISSLLTLLRKMVLHVHHEDWMERPVTGNCFQNWLKASEFLEFSEPRLQASNIFPCTNHTNLIHFFWRNHLLQALRSLSGETFWYQKFSPWVQGAKAQYLHFLFCPFPVRFQGHSVASVPLVYFHASWFA